MPKIVNEDVYKLIDRTNKQMMRVFDEMQRGGGTDRLYSRYMSILESVVPAQYLTTGKHGLVISKSAAAQAAINTAGLERLRSTPTASQYRQNVRRILAKETGKTEKEIGQADIDKRLAMQNYVRNAEEQNGKLKYTESMRSFFKSSGKKSYEDLYKAVKKFEAVQKRKATIAAKKEQTDKQRKAAEYDAEHATTSRSSDGKRRTGGSRTLSSRR